MHIFIDTEFTALAREASLISFGAASEDGREFYCELTPVAQEECSGFVREIVLPLLEGGAAACPRRRFAERLAAWLGQLEDPVLLADSDWDIYVVRRAVSGERSRLPGRLTLPGPAGPLDVLLLILAPLAAEALAIFEREVTQHFARDKRQHHALVDARALREGLLAVIFHRSNGVAAGGRDARDSRSLRPWIEILYGNLPAASVKMPGFQQAALDLAMTPQSKPNTDDIRIKEIKELVPPAHGFREYPVSNRAAQTTYAARQAIHRILPGADDRLLVVIGPCSIHDYDAAMEYAGRLAKEAEKYAEDDHGEVIGFDTT